MLPKSAERVGLGLDVPTLYRILNGDDTQRAYFGHERDRLLEGPRTVRIETKVGIPTHQVTNHLDSSKVFVDSETDFDLGRGEAVLGQEGGKLITRLGESSSNGECVGAN